MSSPIRPDASAGALGLAEARIEHREEYADVRPIGGRIVELSAR